MDGEFDAWKAQVTLLPFLELQKIRAKGTKLQRLPTGNLLPLKITALPYEKSTAIASFRYLLFQPTPNSNLLCAGSEDFLSARNVLQPVAGLQKFGALHQQI